MPSWKKFDLLLCSVTLDDKTGHIFAVDTEFDKNATAREFLNNEILLPVIEKQKVLDANKDLCISF